MATDDLVEVADHAEQAREFLTRCREYLAAGDLHQASEKGWGAAAHMAKAVAAAQGWEYATHADFSVVLNQAWEVTRNDRIRDLRGIANELHGNYYRRKRHLNANVIGRDIESVAELVEILAPLTMPSS
ncbi:MAG: HEPN domain-containing protein [Chloroflexi bacterium]|nr:HEPN domain-containing protein [Chloroflexota bacterium]